MAGDPIRPVKLSSNHSVTGICTVDLPRRGKRSAATTALPKRFGQGKRARRLKERVEKAVGARVEWRMKREARGCRSHRGLEIEGRNRAATQKKARPLKRARRHRACAPPPCPRPWNATLPMEPQPAFQRVVRRNGVLDLEFPAQLRRRQAAGPGASTSAAAGGGAGGGAADPTTTTAAPTTTTTEAPAATTTTTTAACVPAAPAAEGQDAC